MQTTSRARRLLVRTLALNLLLLTPAVIFAQQPSGGSASTRPLEDIIRDSVDYWVGDFGPPFFMVCIVVGGIKLIAGGHDATSSLGRIIAGIVLIIGAVGLATTAVTWGQ